MPVQDSNTSHRSGWSRVLSLSVRCPPCYVKMRSLTTMSPVLSMRSKPQSIRVAVLLFTLQLVQKIKFYWSNLFKCCSAQVELGQIPSTKWNMFCELRRFLGWATDFFGNLRCLFREPRAFNLSTKLTCQLKLHSICSCSVKKAVLPTRRSRSV